MALTRAQLLRRGAALAVAFYLPDVPVKQAPVVRFYNYEQIVRTPLGQGMYFRAGDIMRDELTGEKMRVTAVSPDTLTITRMVERRLWLGAAA